MFDKANISVKNVDKVIAQLEEKIGSTKMKHIIDKALKDGANIIERHIKRNFRDFRDTGESIRQIRVSKIRVLNGKRTISIHWKQTGNSKEELAKARWHIIHMNEYGTIKNPNPRGKGKLDAAMRAGQQAYFKTITNEIERALR